MDQFINVLYIEFSAGGEGAVVVPQHQHPGAEVAR